MGSALRFVVGLAGLLIAGIGVGITAGILHEVLASPSDIDLPAGPLFPTILALLAGAAPLTGGIVLLRKAVRAGSPSLEAPEPQQIAGSRRIAEAEPPLSASQASVQANADVSETPAIREAADVDGPAGSVAAISTTPIIRTRRLWLAMVGLSLALIGLLGELATFGAVVSEYRRSGTTDWVGFALFTLVMAIPIALGLWLANVGDPGLGRRFGTDLVVSVSRLRQPSAIAAALRTSIGLAFAIALAAVLLMLVVRPASAVIGLVGLSAYSLVDPALNVSRRSWWLSAVLSAGTWLALFATLAGTADAIQPMREGVMIFMLPMMLYAAALAISGIVRLFIGGVKRRERLAAK
jgi:hypothetical protein